MGTHSVSICVMECKQSYLFCSRLAVDVVVVVGNGRKSGHSDLIVAVITVIIAIVVVVVDVVAVFVIVSMVLPATRSADTSYLCISVCQYEWRRPFVCNLFNCWVSYFEQMQTIKPSTDWSEQRCLFKYIKGILQAKHLIWYSQIHTCEYMRKRVNVRGQLKYSWALNTKLMERSSSLFYKCQNIPPPKCHQLFEKSFKFAMRHTNWVWWLMRGRICFLFRKITDSIFATHPPHRHSTHSQTKMQFQL